MSHWKRLGNVTKGILREALSNTEEKELTEEELLARLDQIRTQQAQSSKQTSQAYVRDVDDGPRSEQDPPVDQTPPTPPTRKPL